ncbi:MAG TPA: hypothetical protein DEP51_03805 [Clostridiales bacterium]|nr:hypothetical protein [Clostridiales bacterium]
MKKKMQKYIRIYVFKGGTSTMLKTKKLNAIIALQIILSMTLYYFVLVGFTAVTYAIDLIETNNHNVDFSAYFINENGEKTDFVQSEITSEQYLYVDVSVKNEGFFKGKIKINTNNFSIKNDILSSSISEISNNEIHLNQINAGTTETIKVAIKSLEQNNITMSKFNSKADVELSGEYYYSKNIENNRSIDIHGLTNVEVKWISSNNASIETNVETLTNAVFQLNGEDKRVVQLLVNSKLKNNEYPIQKTEITINSLNTIEKCSVFARQTDSTNINSIFNSENYKYDELNKTLKINVLNEDVENISWKKDATDTFVITYILDKNEDITNLISNINTKLTLYDAKELSVDNKIVLTEETQKIVSNDIELTEKEIFKGKLYTGEEREYETTSNININFKDIVEKTEFKQDVSKFISGENEIIANNIYKSTIINKENFNKLFGENGYINIKDENGTIIASINNNTETDENGNIVLNYANTPKALIFETSNPISEGVLRINNKKAILNSGLTREEITNLTGIKETTLSTYNSINKNIVESTKVIELKNTTSKANLSINTESLSAIEKNENVKMEVVLENTNEKMDLFQNPTIKISLPKQVKEISAKCKLIYGNGLELAKANIYKENEQNIIEIDLAGTQASYNTEVVNGTTIIIYADITLDKLIENSDEEIKLNYTNELASNYVDNGEINKNIKIEGLDKETIQRLQNEENEKAKARALAENNQTSDGIKSTLKAYVGGQEIQEGDTVYTGEIVKYELTLENVGEEDIENINIEANVPEATKCVKYIKNTEFTEDENGTHAAEDYFKEIELADRKAISSIDLLKSKKKALLTYDIKIEDESQINDIPFTISINSEKYNNNLTLNCKVEKAEIRLNMYMVGRIDENKIETKRTYTYKLEIKNLKSQDISNLNIKVINNSAVTIEDILLKNDEDLQKIDASDELTVETLKKQDTLVYYLDVQINDNDNNSKISAIANNKYRSNEVEENLLKYIIETNLTSDNAGQEIIQGDNVNYKLTIKNTGNVDINRVDITQSISKYLEVKAIKINNENVEFNTSYEYKDIDKTVDDDDEETNEITESDNYIIEYSYDKGFKVNDKIDVLIETQTNNEELLETDVKIESQAKVFAEVSNKTEKIQHTLKPIDLSALDSEIIESEEIENNNTDNNNKEDETNNSSEKNEDEKNQNNSQEENENTTNKYSISGSVWFDKNENGTMDNSETMIDDVKIQLYNLQDNSTKETTANNGQYIFNELNNGKYILIFEYNKEKYILTKYKANGATENNNSDVENVTLNLNGKEQKVSATDTIEINNANVSNIDLGLIEAKKFDLELTKTISKVTISNQEGNIEKEYDNTNMAKVEIPAKYLSGSTIIIEYNITVKNTGELSGYAKQITDYLPKDLTFNSSLNKDWYQSGEYIYTNSLAENRIEAGETKELKLIVTKKMTESNTGLVNNTAELTSVSNSQNIEDIDSIADNKQTNEDDMGSANIIISVKTGAVISYITITLSITGLFFLAIFVITKKTIKE